MITLKEVLNATGGTLKGSRISSFSGISTDSRHINKGDLFIPLTGKKFDGHKFIGSALKKGASAALSSRKIKPPKDKAVIYVKDTLEAFHKIARSYKERFNIPFIGVTGSSGKTTTKDMLASILSLSGRTLKTEENYNNEIGVPKTLLTLNKTHKYAVIEMAMQGLGEIEELAWMTRPDIAVITNIGSAHMEHLKSGNNIAKAKSETLKFQTKRNFAILSADDKYFPYLKKRARGKVVSFGINSPADVTAKDIRYCSESSSFVIKTKAFQVSIYLPLPGKHNIYDALCAAASAYALGIKPFYIKKGLEKFKLSSKRLNIIHFKDIIIIDDTYNANPDSMAASLGILENYPGRRIAVLGDMFELGKIARKSHENIGRLAANLNIEILITVGKLSKYTAKSASRNGLKNVHITGSNNEAIKTLKKILTTGDTVLIKGSRGMRMEEIATNITRPATERRGSIRSRSK
ncbi:MAG: UDP-N-acetylmuramoyl-tripeptide--D-alanyl-D-alanine ligase [bacterium]